MYAFDTQTNKPRAPNSNSLLYQTLSHQDSLYPKLLCGTGQLKTIFLVQALWNYLNYPILNLIHMSMLPHSFLPVGSLQLTQSCPTLCDPMNHSTPGLPVHHQLPSSLKLMSVESVMASSHLILCRPLLLLPPIPPNIRVFSNESALCMRWPKYWSFSLSISPSSEHPGLSSFRMDWLDLWQSKGLSRVFSNTTVQKHQFFSAQLSSQSNSHIHT